MPIILDYIVNRLAIVNKYSEYIRLLCRKLEIIWFIWNDSLNTYLLLNNGNQSIDEFLMLVDCNNINCIVPQATWNLLWSSRSSN